jgi:protein-S-isoprenylcysteine O-methyltransferase Ste14
MKATQFEFRFRLLISTLLYVLGFLAPWDRLTATTHVVPLWSWLAVRLAQTRLLTTDGAYLAVTIAATLSLVAGAWLRVWGTAYMGSDIVRGGAMEARQLVAAGPYVHFRNPLYAGSFLNAAGISILMPASGALFFLLAIGFFLLRLIGGEEAYLTQHFGDAYREYRQRVPRIIPSMHARVAAARVAPRWLPSMLNETFPIGIALCFAALAWRYDAPLLTRCVLITFGLSLVARAFTARGPAA